MGIDKVNRMNGSQKVWARGRGVGILLTKAQVQQAWQLVRPWNVYGRLSKEEAGKQIQRKKFVLNSMSDSKLLKIFEHKEVVIWAVH